MWRVRGVGRVGARWRRGMCGEAEVRVFWDLNRCGCCVSEVEEIQASRIAPSIVQALRNSGFSGPVSIQAYGNTRALSQQGFLQSLLATGVDLHHVPGAMKDLSNHLLLDLLLWVKENPPPAHMLLISGDKEYSSVLHKLHMRGYKVLLAHPEGDICPDLLSAASRVWVWDSMMKGTDLVARTYESGALPKVANLLHSERVLTRSFNHTEPQFSSCQDFQDELDAKSDNFSHVSKTKLQNIPKDVVKQVLDVIRLRPSGFTLGAFRRQLHRSNVVLDKDFYGHKDLLSFLLSVPKLKASLVWTSDKTRTYLFTEDLTESTGIEKKKEGIPSAKCDYSQDSCSPKHEMVQMKEEEAKPLLGIRVESVSAFQQLYKRSANKEHGKESITEMVTVIAERSPEIVTDGPNAFSVAWRKALSKLSYLTKSLQSVGLKAARTEMAIPEALITCESKLKNQHVDMEAHIGSMTSPILKEEGKKRTSTQKVSSEETSKGDGFKMPKRVMQDNLKACIDCTTSDSALKNGGIFVKQTDMPETLEENGVEQSFSKRESKSELQLQEYELQNDVDTTYPFLQVGEYAILKEAFKDTGIEKQLGQDILSYLLIEGRRSWSTKATTVRDDVLKFLLESNHKGITQLRHEDQTQLAKIFHDRIVMQIQNHSECNTQSKTMDNESLIRASSVTLNKFDSENHMGGLGLKVKEDSSKVLLSNKIGLWEEQDLHKDIPKTSKAKEDGSRMSLSDKFDLHKADIILRDLKKLLMDSKSRVPLASVKPLFKEKYGYELNLKALGHLRLSSLISSLEDFMLVTTNTGNHVIVCSSHEIHKGADSVDIVSSKP